MIITDMRIDNDAEVAHVHIMIIFCEPRLNNISCGQLVKRSVSVIGLGNGLSLVPERRKRRDAVSGVEIDLAKK